MLQTVQNCKMSDEQCTLDGVSISKLKVNDLRKELKARGLNSTGNKTELMDRLLEAVRGPKTDDTSADGSVDELIDEDDVLNDEEIEDEVDYKQLELEVSDKSFDIESTPHTNKSVKRNSSELDKNNSTDIAVKTAKKITLNRHLSTEDELNKSSPATVEANGKTESKKVIKLSDLSAKDRLEMRAKKFGTPLSVDAKKIVRAARFGHGSTTGTASARSTITLNNATPNLDTLKKRAERFGGTLSSELSKAEKLDKMEQRKARFSLTSSANGTTTETQKAKRLDRFKTTLK